MNEWKRYLAPVAIVIIAPFSSAYAVQYLSIAEAQKIAFPAATSFETAHVVFSPEQIRLIEAQSGQKVQTRAEQMWKAIQGDKILGYFIVDYVTGKHLQIDYCIALTPDGTVMQVEILEYRESYGGEIRNPEWLKQFEGKTKDSPLVLNDDIINIGGATLSSRHVTEGVKRVLTMFHVTQQ